MKNYLDIIDQGIYRAAFQQAYSIARNYNENIRSECVSWNEQNPNNMFLRQPQYKNAEDFLREILDKNLTKKDRR